MHHIAHLLRYILLFIALTAATALTAAENPPEAKKFVIVIDAGHGGNDAGAVGACSKEKDINLKVTLEVGRLLKANCPDVKVVFTRTTDVFIPLDTRADIANRNKADLFVSIHTNSLPKGRVAYGVETYTLGMARAAANLEVAKRENSVITYEKNYRQTYEGFDPNKAESYIIFELLQDRYMKQSVELARCIQQQYVSNGRKNKGVHQAGFLVLRKTSMPAVLTELGFISTPEEEAYLNSEKGVSTLARSIYNGICQYRHANKALLTSAFLPTDDSDNDTSERPAPAVVPVATTDLPDGIPQEKPMLSVAAATHHETATPAEERPQTVVRTERPQAATSTKAAQEAVQEKAADDGRPLFRVQILVSDKPLKATDSRFKGVHPVDVYQEGNSYKYTYGATHDYSEIQQLQKDMVARFPGAFVVAFIDGKRTPLGEAIRLSKQKK
jgi:N-acetylmuramoyl-L-alanine amidase